MNVMQNNCINITTFSILFNRPMKLRTKSDAKCELHPKSVNTEVFEPESQWVIYHKMMKTSGVRLLLFVGLSSSDIASL